MKLETRLFIADLTHLDCAFLHPQQGLTGETWRVDAELGGELADNGMLCDFGIVKSRLKQALDAHIDHRLLLCADQFNTLQAQAGLREIEWKDNTGLTRYRAPEEAFALLDVPHIDSLALAKNLQNRMLGELPDNITQLRLWLSPAHDQGPYHYCHGLRQHEGNCQRMAHGHRARMEISLQGQRQHALETHWQKRLQGRYIGAEADLAGTPHQRHRFAYTASQGDFELELPSSRAYLLEAEPTVESLTAHIVGQLAKDHPGQTVVCRAFEGIGKGAISLCSH